MFYNPYENINWEQTEQIPGISHKHCVNDVQYQYLLLNGIRHMAISNYYPSKPVYPLSDYYEVPDGIIQCPNAEQHQFSNPFGAGGRLHLNGLGSLLEKGSQRGQTPIGMNGMDWKDGIALMLSALQFQDAGGVTINHPIWSGLSAKDCCTILDYDNRILGIEIYNQTSEEEEQNGFALDLWDAILKTGRKCYGFSVPDWAIDSILGRNIILANSTEYGCLKAYRNGEFYSKVGNSDFRFTNIAYSNGILNVSTDRNCDITVITDSTRNTSSASSTSVNINANDYVYVRVEAYSANDDDTLYSNPIMLNKAGKEIQDDGWNFVSKMNFFQRYI